MLGNMKKRKTRKAGKASIAWAAKTGSIDVMITIPESCKSSKAKCKHPSMDLDLGSWSYAQLYYPPKDKYDYIYNYSGPLTDMVHARMQLETYFRTFKKQKIIKAYEIQASTMLERYKQAGL
jgi:hypothetical protein